MNTVLQSYLPLSMSYEDYMALTEDLVARNTSTGAATPELAGFTKINLQRMRRVEKTLDLQPALMDFIAGMQGRYTWLLITEPWCGDAAQILPILAGIARASEGRIEFRAILRDEHPDLMDRYLTNGTRSIPMMVCIDRERIEEVGVWGPRPQAAIDLVRDAKQRGIPKDDFVKDLQQWYNQDKGQTIQQEIRELLVRAELLPA
ncbi:MAG: thioredoxin family protein [Bacteroidia bacterium]